MTSPSCGPPSVFLIPRMSLNDREVAGSSRPQADSASISARRWLYSWLMCWVTIWEPDVSDVWSRPPCVYFRPSKPSHQTETDPVVWGRCLVCLTTPMFAISWPAGGADRSGNALFSHHPVVIVSQTRLRLSLLLRWTGRSEASHESSWSQIHKDGLSRAKIPFQPVCFQISQVLIFYCLCFFSRA